VRGRSVLVAGGAGAVGHAAIELAHWAGARVIATVSGEEKAELARAAGADAVVNYRSDDAAEQIRAAAPEGIDRIVELALGPNLELDLAVAARHAVISTYAADQASAEIPIRPLMGPNLVLRFVMVYTIPRAALRAAVDGVSQAIAAGALTPLPIHRFALEDAAGAHDAVEGGVVGKVVIDLP
jgi:NADPH2:quinone reductase